MASRQKYKLEADDGDDGDERTRSCAITRHRRPVSEMLRFVADPSGRIMPDVAGKLPGRGVWIEAKAATIAKAVTTRAFARSLKRPVEAPAELPELVEAQLRQRTLAAFSIANKAGELVFGFSKIESAIAAGNPALVLVHASDARPDGCRKLDGPYRKILGDGAKRPIRIFTSSELSLALGRSNVIHAALTGGGASLKLLEALARLQDFRPGDDNDAAALDERAAEGPDAPLGPGGPLGDRIVGDRIETDGSTEHE